MKHNHIEEVLLIIAANAFAIYILPRYTFSSGIDKIIFPFQSLAAGEVFPALIYSTPFLFYLLAVLIFLRKKEILGFKKKQMDKEL
jgi:hypothetical protein